MGRAPFEYVRIETDSQVVRLSGDEHLRSVKIRDGAGNMAEHSVGGLFIMIGADPCTGWLKEAVRLDDRGFVLTGEDCGTDAAAPFNVFQTSLPGVFAVGDVRSGSVKRVASAVSEGLCRRSGDSGPARLAPTGGGA